jgi:two-component system, NarL family, nitrate/nitrite response regulator NarL
MYLGDRPINVFVVAPLLLCWGLEKLLKTAGLGVRIAATAQSAEDALQVVDQVHAHVVLLDVEEEPDPAVLAQLASVVPIMLLTSDGPGAKRAEALTAHAAAVARKSDSPSTLLRAIERASESRRPASGHYPVRAWLEESRCDDPDQIRISRLTEREKKLIVALLCNDTAPGKVIATRLCISEHTLRNHLSSIYGKLGVPNRLGLHTFATKYGLYRLLS